ncbi:hypothetical protein CR203_16385 [Salipaludibacillus neizhouensis]|uniref:Uncharacterized protein n=1 Tax=Salipaludibacillus neizhouensis TaxID=885475 RepID=A0A3A9KN30_9BACI|nr:hypothetical protein CR203_16385 [Salipaludibacillus neizhouensis]
MLAFLEDSKIRELEFATGERFPRATLQPPRETRPAGSSAVAFPAGVATFLFYKLLLHQKN